MTTDTITPYRAQIPDGRDYGVPVAYVRELAARWRNGFDRRAQETRLNQYEQFLTTIDAEQMHFVIPSVPGMGSPALPGGAGGTRPGSRERG